MSRRVGILRVDRRIEALDRLERALLQAAVRLHQLSGPRAEGGCLALQCLRSPSYEQRQRGVQGRKDREDGEPDEVLAGGDEALGALRPRVDLVGADGSLSVRA